MGVGNVESAFAAPGFVHHHVLEMHAQAQFLGEPAGRISLGGVARGSSAVRDLQLALPVERVELAAPGTLGAPRRGMTHC